MTIRIIMVPLDGGDAARPALELALVVAKRTGAHLEALHVRADPKDAVPLLGEGMSGAMIEELIDLTEKEAESRSARARSMFDAVCRERHLRDRRTGRCRAQCGLARNHRPGGRNDGMAGAAGRPHRRRSPDGGVGSPVDPDAERHRFREWPAGSRRASDVGALPLIAAAEAVTIFTTETEKTPETAAGELRGYLAGHGISAEQRSLTEATGRWPRRC